MRISFRWYDGLWRCEARNFENQSNCEYRRFLWIVLSAGHQRLGREEGFFVYRSLWWTVFLCAWCWLKLLFGASWCRRVGKNSNKKVSMAEKFSNKIFTLLVSPMSRHFYFPAMRVRQRSLQSDCRGAMERIREPWPAVRKVSKLRSTSQYSLAYAALVQL